MLKINSASTSETEEIGYKLAQKVSNTAVIALYGGLGMGKTAFTRGFARGLGVDDNIMSPTFAIVNEYIGITKIYHFDMYRIQSWEDLQSTGYFDYLDNGIIVIEWSENIESAIPKDAIRVSISKGKNENERIFEIEGVSSL